MVTLDKQKVSSFFKQITNKFPVNDENICVILVTHLLPDRPFLISGINDLVNIISIIPKEKSLNTDIKNLLSNQYNIDLLSRNDIDSTNKLIDLIKPRLGNKKLILLDIGGYFAKSLDRLNEALNHQILGVIEDTENGLQKYLANTHSNIPIISVARSPLKNPEDFLVGQSIVFSTEALLREQGDILHGKTACVIGYGKLGSSIAKLLNSRYVHTTIYDSNPIKLVEAMSQGFNVSLTLKNALKNAQIIFCATGNLALKKEDFKHIKHKAYVTTVTSADDELELEKLKSLYTIVHTSNYKTRYRTHNKEHEFYILNRGQAVNFIHGAAVGPFIYLIQAEILASISIILSCKENNIIDNNEDLWKIISNIWLDVFISS